ncbi:MAG: DUF2058 domain-containing protein [Steroidobacteraceae bacterium]
MSLSLRDQLLQAGLVTEKQVRQAEQQQNRPPRQQQSKKERQQPSVRELAAQKAQAEKAERDRELARKQQEKAERKARWAQVRQLIEQHKVPRVEGEDYYHFTDGRMVKRLSVNAELRAQIQAGTLQIARCDGKYELVPTAAAERIREREPAAIVRSAPAGAETQPGADDPYAQHVVPDDLMW